MNILNEINKVDHDNKSLAEALGVNKITTGIMMDNDFKVLRKYAKRIVLLAEEIEVDKVDLLNELKK